MLADVAQKKKNQRHTSSCSYAGGWFVCSVSVKSQSNQIEILPSSLLIMYYKYTKFIKKN